MVKYRKDIRRELFRVFRCGDLVLYGIHGVCRILDLEERRIDRKKIEYFVLEPLEQPGSRFYVPTQNEAAVSKLRPMLTKQQLEQLLHAERAVCDGWVADENQRKQLYRELINSGDRAALVRMVRALHLHKRQQIEAGKKVHLCDENFLRDAERLLASEFSLVLDIEQNAVAAYIQHALEND